MPSAIETSVRATWPFQRVRAGHPIRLVDDVAALVLSHSQNGSGRVLRLSCVTRIPRVRSTAIALSFFFVEKPVHFFSEFEELFRVYLTFRLHAELPPEFIRFALHKKRLTVLVRSLRVALVSNYECEFRNFVTNALEGMHE